MTLQEMIYSAIEGSTITLPDDAEYIGNFVINKALTIQGKAKIITPNTFPAIDIPPGTGPVSLKGKSTTEPLQIIASSTVYTIIRYGNSGSAQDSLEKCPQGLLIEFAEIQGTPGQESQRGITANGKNFEIRHSKVREIHGEGYDTQAICAWNGPGPFKITDCYLEAAGENVMFGGADAAIEALTPANIEIRRCYFFKPQSWNYWNQAEFKSSFGETVRWATDPTPGPDEDPSDRFKPRYVGPAGNKAKHWTVKNLLETKNCHNIIVDGNIFENCWPDAQVGFAILIKSNNQEDTNPWAATTDLVFSNNWIKNATHGLNIMGIENPPKVSGISARLKFINNLWEIDGIALQGFQGGQDILLDHNTVLSAGNGNNMTLYSIPVSGLVATNNLGKHTSYGIKGDGTGEGSVALNTFAPGYVYKGNVLAEADPNAYPAGNFYPPTWAEVKFGDNYQLAADSPFKGKGTDGKDPGYDMIALLAAQSETSSIPQPAPVPAPTPTPTQVPAPSPSPVPAPCTMTINAPILKQWSTGKLIVTFTGLTAPGMVSVTPTTGQITVLTEPKEVSGTSMIAEFLLQSKKKPSSVIVSGPCGSKTVQIKVQ